MTAGKPLATVYYDGACPLCSAEIAHYRGLDGEGAIDFVDIAQVTGAPAEGLSREAAMARFHVRKADGTIVSGAGAFIALWRLLPGWRWAARFSVLPGVLPAMERAYRAFLPMRPRLAKLVHLLSSRQSKGQSGRAGDGRRT